MVLPDFVVELLDDMIRKGKSVLPDSDTSRETMAIMCIHGFHEMCICRILLNLMSKKI